MSDVLHQGGQDGCCEVLEARIGVFNGRRAVDAGEGLLDRDCERELGDGAGVDGCYLEAARGVLHMR